VSEKDEAKALADAHWDFQARWLEMVLKDAFVHGYKHGWEAKSEQTEEPRAG